MCLKGLGSHYTVEQQRDPARRRSVQDGVDQERTESSDVEALVRYTDREEVLDEQYAPAFARPRSPV